MSEPDIRPAATVYIDAVSDDDHREQLNDALQYLQDLGYWIGPGRADEAIGHNIENLYTDIYNDDRTKAVTVPVRRRDRTDEQYAAWNGVLDHAKYAEHVVVAEFAVVTRKQVLDVLDHHAAVHSAREGISLHPTAGETSDAVLHAIDTLTGGAMDAEALLRGIPHKGGRPPLGTTGGGGTLKPGENYRQVCRVLQDVKDGRTTKSEAAHVLDCSPKTIDRALDRPALYQLD